MKTILRLFVLFGFILVVPTICSFSQVGINSDGSPPDPSAGLDVKFNNKGFLPPRMTHADLNAIPNPANGLVVYCTDCGSTGLGALSMFMGGTWYTMNVNCLNPPSSPIAGTPDSTCSQIVFHWSAVPGAAGYRVNQNNDYASAFDVGNVLTATAPNCTPGTLYSGYIWAYNDCGHSAPTTLSCHTLPGLCIGLSYEGGIIFYIDGTGQHGLISATTDQSTGAEWGCYGTLIGGTSTAIGTGQANTTAIVNGCSTSGIAARICDELVLNGYDDWFLPSSDELTQMYLQKTVIGGFADVNYWSSSEYDADNAWDRFFNSGAQGANLKSNPVLYVRAIRAF